MKDEALSYPMRQYGMDHARYDWSMLTDRKSVQWPQGKTLALWVNVNLQFFPLNPTGQPIKVAGNMSMPYPDLRHYSLRDYGNRVGIYRMLDVLDRYTIHPTVAINTRLAERYPALLKTITDRGDEILAHSWSMDTAHAGGLEEAQETQLVSDSLSRLRELSGQEIRGWLSPGKQQSENTPELLRDQGIEYVCDWVNDDMPYRFNTNNGGLWSMPLSTELEDRFVLMDNLHSAASWAEQITDACDFLLKESQEQGGRILALNLHPWVVGQPHRIKYLSQALQYISTQTGVWSATAGDILDAFTAQQ